MDKVSILIADDHELIHKGISDILMNIPKYFIAGHAFNGKEVIDLAREIKPDIILMDISMPKVNGLEATRKIIQEQPGTKIIALSQHEEREYVTQMLEAGCFGYLLKNSRKDEIITALDMVTRNKKYINPNMIDMLMSGDNDKNENQGIRLTNRELEVLKNISEGKNNPEIANQLSISVRTVETHRRNLMQKLKVSSVVELLKAASKLKLIDL